MGSQSDFDDEEIRKAILSTFIEESMDNIATLERSLLDMEEHKGDREFLNESFRAIHTIKGGAFSLDFTKISDLAHYSEFLLQQARDGERSLGEDDISLLLTSTAAIKEHMIHIEKTEAEHSNRNFSTLAQLEDLAGESSENTESIVQDSSSEAPLLATKGAESNMIKIYREQLDRTIQVMGDLILVKNKFIQIGSHLRNDRLATTAIRNLELVTDDLQRRVSDLRLSHLDSLFSSMRPVVRSVALELKKEVQLDISGGSTLIDRQVLEAVREPLIHILRNAVDHGIESKDVRAEYNKDPVGKIKLSASYKSGEIQVTVSDDGGGINTDKVKELAIERGVVQKTQSEDLSKHQIMQLICEPGFSTSDEISQISGRGVGMDVVKDAVRKINGNLEINSERYQGTTFLLRLPINFSIIESLFFKVNKNSYSLPLNAVVEVFPSESPLIDGKIEHLATNLKIVKLRDQALPLVNLGEFFGGPKGDCKAYILVDYAMSQLVLEVDRIQESSSAFVQPINDDFKLQGPFSGISKDMNGNAVLQLELSEVVSHITSRGEQKTENGSSIAKLSELSQSDLVRLRQKIIVFECGSFFGFPVQKADSIIYAYQDELKKIGDANQVFLTYEGRTIPVMWPHDILHPDKKHAPQSFYWMALIKSDFGEFALALEGFSGIKIMPMDFQLVDYHNSVIGSTQIENETIMILSIDRLVKSLTGQRPGKNAKKKEKYQESILVVEDELFFRTNMTHFLQSYEYRVIQCENGEEAVNILQKENNISSVVTDVEMPIMDGVELIKWIRKHEKHKNIQILVLSALTNQPVIDNLYEVGADYYCSKMNHREIIHFLKNRKKLSQEDYMRARTGHVDPMIKEMITFSSGGKVFSIPINYVKEVGVSQVISAVPHNHHGLGGLTSFQGQIIPCLNHTLLSEKEPPTEVLHESVAPMRIIIDLENTMVSLSADSIGRVISVDDLIVGEGMMKNECVFTNLIENIYRYGDILIYSLSRSQLFSLIESHYDLSALTKEVAS